MPSKCKKKLLSSKAWKGRSITWSREDYKAIERGTEPVQCRKEKTWNCLEKLKRGSISKVTAVGTTSPMPPNSQSATLDMENNAPKTTNNGYVDSSLALKSGETVSIHAINCVKAVFSNVELETGTTSPNKPSTRKILEPIRVNNIKQEVKVKFPNEWEEARRATNQLCRNVKAKRNNGPAVVNQSP